MKIDGNSFANKVAETVKKVEVKVAVKTNTNENTFSNSKIGENNFVASTVKTAINKLFDAQKNPTALKTNLSPSQALDEINKLPTPNLNDPAAVQAYQQQRVSIANAALATAKPPTRADFNGLPPQVANMEYRDALSYYNSSVQKLKEIAATPTNLTGNPVDESAKRVWEAGQRSPQEGAKVLAQEIKDLNDKYGPGAGGQLMEKLYRDSKDGNYDHNLNNILSFAGGKSSGNIGSAGLSESDRNAVGTAIGQAYDKMSPTDRAEFVKGLVSETENDGFRGNALNGDATRIADLISRSGNSKLKSDMVDALTKRMVEIQPKLFGNNGGVDIKALANSAAIIAGSGATGADQAAMFTKIIKSFPSMNGDQLKSLMDDPTLKDNLSKVFINNSEAIIKSLTNEAGGMLDANSSDGLRQFFEMTMFSKNPGQLRSQVMSEAVRVISKFGDPTASPTSGRSKVDDARTAGSLLGLVQAAARKQRDSIKSDQKSRDETTRMFVGLAFAFAPGASKILGEGANKGLEFAYGKAVDYAKSNAESGLSGLINKLNDGESLKNIDEGFKAIRDLSFQVEKSLEGENNKALYDAFDLGYSRTGVDQLFADALGR